MKTRKGYKDAPEEIAEELKNSIPVKDFLPPPEEIANDLKKEKTVFVTMRLRKKTVERYKLFAAQKGIKYQQFVSSVLDQYAQKL
jgi:predicted DNA binding CopG/RHH family protein